MKRVERPRELTWYQAGGMLYGDWGTSKAYVLGIALALAGHASWFFLGLMSVLVTFVGFCYMIICRNYPDGGGVYSSVKSRSQTLAVIGALLLVADYVVTASLSVLDAFHYFNVPNPEYLAVLAILVIGFLNWFGPTKSGNVAVAIALTASTCAVVLLSAAMPSFSKFQLTMPHGDPWSNWAIFVGIILALSGVEAVANMTGVMVQPVEKTSRKAILPVLLEVAIVTFLLGIAMNAIPGLTGHTEDMLRALGAYYIGPWYGAVIAIVFGFLLLSAGNTAISALVGIQFALTKDHELPPIFSKLNRYGMPWFALLVATVIPIVVLIAERDIVNLAALYAIGVVGAITMNLLFSSINTKIKLSKLERVVLAVGALITGAIEITIAFQKPNALIFVLCILSVGLILRRVAKSAIPSKTQEFVTSVNVLTVREALELAALYKSTTYVALRAVNLKLLEEVALRVKAKGENSVYLGYVESAPVSSEMPAEIEPSRESIAIFEKAQEVMRKFGITAVPIWQMGDNPGRLISYAARALGVETVAIGVTKRSGLINLIREDVLNALAKNLHKDCRLLIVG